MIKKQLKGPIKAIKKMNLISFNATFKNRHSNNFQMRNRLTCSNRKQ